MNYAYITKCDQVNGDGLRVTLWVTGCPNHCEGCQNEWSWDPHTGVPFDNEAYKELLNYLNHDYISGLTFCGGEPLAPYNFETVTALAKDIREQSPSKSIWCYTGYTYEDLADLEIMDYLDVLIDGRFVKELKDPKLKWRGSSNQRVIDVKKTREVGNICLHCE
jgi:anaerobic ribonucleoside-triphosphate reductase activating protein